MDAQPGFRFGEARVCWWCGRTVIYSTVDSRVQATREHLKPRSMGGQRNPENIVVACKQCNTHRKSETDWVPFHQIEHTVPPLAQWAYLARIGRLAAPARDAYAGSRRARPDDLPTREELRRRGPRLGRLESVSEPG